MKKHTLLFARGRVKRVKVAICESMRGCPPSRPRRRPLVDDKLPDD
jgi:hypothetical protein